MKSMRKICVFALWALLVLPVLQAQGLKQNIRGKVFDRDSQMPLAGAKVMVISTDPVLGAIADEGGRFLIEEVPIGRQTLQVSYLGYEPYVASQLVITTGKELVLEIAMTESVKELETVVILSEGKESRQINQMASVSTRKFSVEETQRYAASLNDPGRMASAFAGVQPSADGRNDIVIRGNSPSGLLWRMETVDIPNPNHFANPGGSGGGISMVSNYLLSNSDFMTGAFPAEYGNALSGVFDLKLRKGNTDHHEFRLQAGVLGIDVASEGPISKKTGASYLVNYRYSTLGLMELIGLPIVQGAVYQYQDLSFNLTFPVRPGERFELFGVGGLSSQTVRAERDSSTWETLGDKADELYGTDMGAVGFKHLKLLKNGRTYVKTILSATANRNRDSRDTLDFDYQLSNVYQEQFVQAKVSLSQILNHKFNSRHLIRGGYYLHRRFYDLRSEYTDPQSGQRVAQITGAGAAWLLQPFFQWQWRLNSDLRLNAGTHSLWFSQNQDFLVEPRAGLSWQLSNQHTLSLGYGLHSQILPLGTYFAEFPQGNGTSDFPNRDLRLTKAHHFVLGHQTLLAKNLFLKSELYYQHLFDVPVGTASNPTLSTLNTNWGFETDSLINAGSGRNYGLELTLEKLFSKNYYFLVTGSLYESKFRALDGIERDTRYNGNYALNFLGGKEIWFGREKRNYFELSGRVVLLGGQRFSPIDLEASRAAGRTVLDADQTLALQQRPYFRTDIRIAWHQNRPKASHILSFDVQNVFNTPNSFVQYYDAEKDEILSFYQAGIVPIIAYRLDFGGGKR